MRRAAARVAQALAAASKPGCTGAARLLRAGLGSATERFALPLTAVALRPTLLGGRGFSAGGGEQDGAGGSANSQRASEAWEEISQLSLEATEISEEGRHDEAKQMLRKALPGCIEKYGAQDPSVGMLHNQLALWAFNDGDYREAAEQARAAYDIWLKDSGEESAATAFHGIRLGMALAADGRPEEAFPLLETGLAVAVENYNQQVEQLESLQPLAEDGDAAAAEASEADEAAMAARAQQQRVAIAMLERLGRALQEAKFYRALSFLGVRGRELNDTWDEKGAGATFFLQQEMSDALADMLRWVAADHPTVHSALREHSRLVAQCAREGLRRLADDLQIHGQRLQDVVAEASNGKDG